MQADESVHWADRAAERIIREKGDKGQYTIAAGITPSGIVHIGNFREIITAHLIERALKDRKKKVRFIYSWDDYDVFRKVPVNLPNQEELKKHLRKPVSAVPDPFGCHESYAQHFEKQVEEALPAVGIRPEFISQQQMYRRRAYAQQIRQALEQTAAITPILNRYRKEPLAADWLPITVFCGRCGRDTARTAYDGEYQLTYTCACGASETIDFRKAGIVKLKWRVDWPMRWSYENVDFESGGKDHFAAGGSYDTGKQIVAAVWKRDPPTSIRYEWIGVKGGEQFHSSTGNVVTLQQLLEVYEPEVVRYLFASTRPEAEFAISFDADVIKICEDFDACERTAFAQHAVSAKEQAKQRRIYELSFIGTLPASIPFQPSFRHLTTILQIHQMDCEKATGFLEHELRNAHDRRRLEQRALCAKRWLEQYAPEQYRFTVQAEVPEGLQLGEKQRQALKILSQKLRERDWTDIELHEEFYVLCKNLGLSNTDFFEAAYQVLVNKPKGPRLASFILHIGREQVAELFEGV